MSSMPALLLKSSNTARTAVLKSSYLLCALSITSFANADLSDAHYQRLLEQRQPQTSYQRQTQPQAQPQYQPRPQYQQQQAYQPQSRQQDQVKPKKNTLQYTPTEERWSDFLPIWGKEAKAQGYELPRPFGIGIARTDIDMTVTPYSSEVMLGSAKLADLETGSVHLSNVKGRAAILRGDVWVFPFLNVYGLLGDLQGRTTGTVQLPKDFLQQATKGLAGAGLGADLVSNIVGGLGSISGINDAINAPISRNYPFTGQIQGLGATVAGGYKSIFGLIDYNQTHTAVDVLRQRARADVWTARLGWNGKYKNRDLRIWGGMMKQNISQTVNIKISNLNFPVLTDVVINTKVGDEAGETPLAGLSYQISDNWTYLLESRFGDRKILNNILEYRF
ncbi:MAG: hypothetical protein AAGF06_08300 [Pseudomonadota bacterium]